MGLLSELLVSDIVIAWGLAGVARVVTQLLGSSHHRNES